MAKLNQDDSALPFAAAVTAMSLGTGKRLIRNFTYYKQTHTETVSRRACLSIYRELRFNVFSLQNMYLDDARSEYHGSFKVMIAKQIQDNLEELHRKVLFFDTDDIVDLIPVLDQLRAFWANSSEPAFYDNNLSVRLDEQIIPLLSDIENYLLNLPELSDS
ncbi:hypothetical protein [Rhodohalobacter sp. 8-1]|uniref:hypothetical protein n=1 Tax=Rhodohalobacter sp. 8-1 TaxID=3131972 RepID=UPI0030EEA33D